MIITFDSISQKTEKNQISIPIACGFIGYTSPEIISLQKLDSIKNYGTIRQKLFSGSDLEKVVVAIMLEEYQLGKKIKLSIIEIEAIKNLKKSRQKYSLCYTCTVHLDGTLADLFRKNNSQNQPVFSAYHLIKQAVLN